MQSGNWSPLVKSLDPIFDRVRRDVHWERPPGQPPSARNSALTYRHLQHHVNGGPYCGASAIEAGGSTTRVAVLDFDSHKGETPWGDMANIARNVASSLDDEGLRAIPFRSSGGHGIHLYVLWDEPQDAYTVRETLKEALCNNFLEPGVGGVARGEVEIFPKQDTVPEGGWGSMFILPLAGESVPLDERMLPQKKDTPIGWHVSKPLAVKPRPPKPEVEAHEIAGFDEVKELLERIPNDDLDYDAWRNIIFAVHSATAGEGLELARQWSAKSSKHDDWFFTERVWPYITDRADGITINTLRAAARKVVASPEEFDAIAAEVDTHDGTAKVSDFEDLTDGKPEEKKARFAVTPVVDFAVMPKTLWLIKGVLPSAEVAVMYGPPASGKSFMAIDMAVAMAKGWDWRGLKTRKCRVAYVAAEGVNGVRKRFLAIKERMGVDLSELDIWVIPAAPNLLEINDAKDLARALVQAGKFDVIFVDTVAQTMPGGNENSGEDMGKFLTHCKGINRATGATVVLIHHSGKDETRGARGWSGLRGAVDAEFEVARADDDRVLIVSKQKDGEDGGEFGFRLGVVKIGEDEEGDDITSCVVEHTNTTAAGVKKRGRPLGPNEQCLCQAFDEINGMDDAGVAPDDLVTLALQKREMPDDHNSRRNMRRALTKLTNSGRFVEKDGLLHMPETEE